MNLSDYDLSANATRGFEMVVRDPITDKPTDAVISIIGSDSKTYRKVKNETLRRVAKGDDLDADQISAAVYTACVTGWRDLSVDGKPLEYSVEAANDLLVRFPWLMDQIGTAVESRSNFTRPSEKT